MITSMSVMMAGCKIAVMVLEGGEVQSTSSGTCIAGTNCIVEVDDTNFSETFTAVPDTGWYFEKWNSGNGFLCGESTDPACFVSNEKANETDLGTLGLIRSDTTYYLMPVFWRKPPTISAGGKEWLRPEEFPYTAEQVRAICPGPDGVCTGSLEVRHLRGLAGGGMFNLSGYIWASSEEVSALFNAYGVYPPFSAPFEIRENQDAMADYVKDFDFVYDLTIGFHGGLIRDSGPSEGRVYCTSEIYNPQVQHGTFKNMVEGPACRGAWFWKSVGVP